MNNMSALDEALDILPFTVTVDGKAVKEAVIDQVAKELCSSLRQQASGSSFDVTDEAMKQALAGALILTQQRVIANPPTVVKIATSVSNCCVEGSIGRKLAETVTGNK